MSSRLRWTVLAVFAASGIAIAVGLAVSKRGVSDQTASRFDSGSVVIADKRDTGSWKPVDPSSVTAPAIVAAPVNPVPTPAFEPSAPQVLSTSPAQVEPRPLMPAPQTARRDVIPFLPTAIEDDPSIEVNNQFFDSLKNQPKPAGPILEPSPRATQEDTLPPAKTSDGLPLPPIPGAGKAIENPKVDKPAPKPNKNRIARVPGEGDDHLTIHIQDMDIREVLEMMSEQGGMNILASNSVNGKVSASLMDVDIDTALKAILRSTGYSSRHDGKFIYVGTQQDFQSIEQNLDRVGTRIYRPNYIRAADVQHLIAPLLTPTVGSMSVSAPAEVGIGADSNKAGGDGFAGGEAVLVKDYEAVLAQVDQVVAEIDQRPLQVHIEAMILSVKLDDEHSMGVDFLAFRDKKTLRLASGSPLEDLGDLSFKDGGLKVGFLDTSLGVFINALETVGDTNVIATPRLMCLNKHRAEILIGSQLGYVSTTVTETSTSQRVEFLEVGTQLRLRPFISTDGLIRMEVHPELSTGSVEIKGDFTLPEKEVTQVTTNVMARDGSTVIIGGLIRDDLSTTASQIPLLGNIPGLGVLFRQKKEGVRRHEILVLITPHIVYDYDAGAEGDRAACEFYRRQNVYADEMSPIGKRYMGRKYFRLAQQAWDDNDADRAMRFVNMSIHFDPISRPAIDLRSDIWLGRHGGPYSGGAVAAAGSVTMLDGGRLPPWLLNDLQGANRQPGQPLHPKDPGTPGTSRNIERPRQLP